MRIADYSEHIELALLCRTQDDDNNNIPLFYRRKN